MKTTNTQSENITLRDLNEKDTFRFPYDPPTMVRRLEQKGRIDGYCPYDGQNTMGHNMSSGDEIYILSAKVIPIKTNNTQPSRIDNISPTQHTPGRWWSDHVSPWSIIKSGSKSLIYFRHGKDISDEEGRANVRHIIDSCNEYDKVKKWWKDAQDLAGQLTTVSIQHEKEIEMLRKEIGDFDLKLDNTEKELFALRQANNELLEGFDILRKTYDNVDDLAGEIARKLWDKYSPK